VTAAPGRELGRIKLALTSACELRCSYCFIDKDRGETLSPAAGSRLLRDFIGAPGKTKIVGLYGGEPLARFPLLESMILAARGCGREFSKDVFLSVATNGLLLNDERLDFFRREDVQLCVSIDGAENDRFRVRRDGGGSLRGLLPKIQAARSRLPASRLTALQGVHPENAAALFANMTFIRSLGFETVNLEMIQGVAWDARARKDFVRGFRHAAEDISRRIAAGDSPFFLQSVNRALAGLSAAGPEPETVEVYPNGAAAALAYPFRHLEEALARRGPRAGARGLERALGPGRAMVRLRQALSRRFARRLLAASRTEPLFARYVARAAAAGARS
jgi:sulfatase maturation enzyme AslB (radical SAM superfamily)